MAYAHTDFASNLLSDFNVAISLDDKEVRSNELKRIENKITMEINSLQHLECDFKKHCIDIKTKILKLESSNDKNDIRTLINEIRKIFSKFIFSKNPLDNSVGQIHEHLTEEEKIKAGERKAKADKEREARIAIEYKVKKEKQLKLEEQIKNDEIELLKEIEQAKAKGARPVIASEEQLKGKITPEVYDEFHKSIRTKYTNLFMRIAKLDFSNKRKLRELSTKVRDLMYSNDPNIESKIKSLIEANPKDIEIIEMSKNLAEVVRAFAELRVIVSREIPKDGQMIEELQKECLAIEKNFYEESSHKAERWYLQRS